jgi:hypothetical protein
VLCVSAQSGCSDNYEEETTLLERAESNYTAGEYDAAAELYERFLREHPRSPYAEVAAQRLRIVERELEAVMGRRGTATPERVDQRLPAYIERREQRDRDPR